MGNALSMLICPQYNVFCRYSWETIYKFGKNLTVLGVAILSYLQKDSLLRARKTWFHIFIGLVSNTSLPPPTALKFGHRTEPPHRTKPPRGLYPHGLYPRI